MKILLLILLLTSCGVKVSENIKDGTLTMSVDGTGMTIKRVEYKDAICFLAVGYQKGGISCLKRDDK